MENFIFCAVQSLLPKTSKYFAVTVFPTSPSEKTVYLKLKHIARPKFTIFKSIFRKVLEKSSLEMLSITFFTLPDISARFEYFVVIYAFLSMLLYS